ncbi:MAG TPA: PEGA domain-containing protein [Myxococcales bacterium]|jgi:tetratricopeptide (TPR) repeat protein|nr:PEGA domain-containing protein [Myxococcales bacterium]
MRARDWRLPLSLLSLVASAALAADDLAEAKRHFETGQTLYKEARYKEAVTEFEQAIALSIKLKPESAGVANYNLGQAHEKLGDIGAAVKAYKEYLRLSPRAPDRAAVQTIIGNLEARLARGVQELSVSSDPSGSNVAVDGKLRSTTPVTMELPYGSHQLEVSHEGYDTATRAVDLTPQSAVKLDISLAKKAAPLPPPAQVEKPRIWTWVALGTAAVATGTGAYFGSQARRNADLLRAAKNTPPVPDELYDASVTDQVVANVLYGTAGAAAIAGGVLFFVEGKF